MSQSQVLYGLEDRPGFAISLTAAIQHVLASFIGVVTPTLIYLYGSMFTFREGKIMNFINV